jgi:protoheme IX farnesyltransferase
MLKEYYNLAKPGIIYSNLLTAAAGLFLASRYHVHGWILLAMLAGMAGIIGGACVFNNIIDRDIDARMKRTSARAMVTGAISKAHALAYGIILAIVGALILFFYTNLLTLLVALAAAILYVALYTPLKRHSEYSALVGSIPGAAPPVVGYAAVTHHLDLAAFLLFIILCLWQMPHFYAIAIYRMQDYREANVPVFSIENGVPRTKRQIITYMILFIAAVILLYSFGYAGMIYLIAMLAIALTWLALGLQGFRKNTDDVRWARKVFLFSLIVITTFSVLISVNPK